jgi:hypothetical protein
MNHQHADSSSTSRRLAHLRRRQLVPRIVRWSLTVFHMSRWRQRRAHPQQDIRRGLGSPRRTFLGIFDKNATAPGFQGYCHQPGRNNFRLYYRRARLQPGKRPGLDSLRRRFLGIFDKSAIDPALREWLRQRIAHTVRSDLRRERRDQDKPLASGSVKNKDPHICHTTEIHFAAPIYPPPSVSSVTAAKNLMRASGGVNRCWSGLPLHRRPS